MFPRIDTSVRFWIYSGLSVMFNTLTIGGWLVEDQINIYFEAIFALSGVLMSTLMLGLALITLANDTNQDKESGR